jgi:hypothetical protein
MDEDNQIAALIATGTDTLRQIQEVCDRYGFHYPLIRGYGQRPDFTREEWVRFYQLTNAAGTDALNRIMRQIQPVPT